MHDHTWLSYQPTVSINVKIKSSFLANTHKKGQSDIKTDLEKF